MYEWSKKIVEKIEKANCLSPDEIRVVEIALRMQDIYEDLLDECIGVSKENLYELQHRW